MTAKVRLVLVLLAAAVAWFVWPTPYRTIGLAGVMQVNRFTGARCPVGESCWRMRGASLPPSAVTPARRQETPQTKPSATRNANPYREYLRTEPPEVGQGKR
jgi:hypothetical protein